MEAELSRPLGVRRLDLRTAAELSRWFRHEIVRDAEVQYVADDRVRLRHVADAVEAASQFIEGRSRDDLDTDRMLVFALVRDSETAALGPGGATSERTGENGAMERAVIVKGRVTDSRHIELDEPVDDIAGEVEVTVRPLTRTQEDGATDIEALMRIVDEWRGKHPDQLRSKEDIDRYLAEERASWGDDER
jgi:hypothetical protein